MSVVVSRALAVVLGVVALTSTATAYANAATPESCQSFATVAPIGYFVIGSGHTICDGSGGEPVGGTDDPVQVQRRASGSSHWAIVATGVGTATYTCQGSALNYYRAVTPYAVSTSAYVNCG